MSNNPTQASNQGGVPPVHPSHAEANFVSGSVVSGDGGVTSFHDNGGHLLKRARIVLIFWGTAWTNASTNPSRTDFTNAITNLINGPWATQMAQYRGIGPLSLEQTVTVTSSNPPTSFTDPNIRDMINAQITAGAVPTPSSSIDRLYCVIMPTGHSSSDTPFVGQHQFHDRSGTRVYWAWTTNDGTLTGGNSVPKVLSHEICEALSDPDLGTGILVDIGADKNEEIGDVCNSTWATVNGAAQEAYWSQADNRCVIPIWQAFPAVSSNPVLIQGKFGTKGNFELLSPSPNGGLMHFWRNNDNPFMPWSTATPFGQGVGAVDGLTMIESNFGSPGNLEVVCNAGGKLQFFWRDSGPAFHWNGPSQVATGVSGDPALIQSRFGTKGNFEMVVPSANAGLLHFWRNNDVPSLPWSAPTPFGTSLGKVDAVTLIQSNFGSPGNLEVICRVGGQLHFFWRDSGPSFHWNGPSTLQSGVSGDPVLIQSRFGTKGNFEMVVPSANAGLLHFWRNNDVPSLPWSAPTPFGTSLGKVDAVTLIQSNFGSPGNLEVICRVGGQLHFFWRDSGPAFHWNGPFLLQSTIW